MRKIRIRYRKIGYIIAYPRIVRIGFSSRKNWLRSKDASYDEVASIGSKNTTYDGGFFGRIIAVIC